MKKLLAGLVLVLISACGRVSITASDLVGTWKSNYDSIIVYKADATFTFAAGDNLRTASGTYSVADNKLSLTITTQQGAASGTPSCDITYISATSHKQACFDAAAFGDTYTKQ